MPLPAARGQHRASVSADRRARGGCVLRSSRRAPRTLRTHGTWLDPERGAPAGPSLWRDLAFDPGDDVLLGGAALMPPELLNARRARHVDLDQPFTDQVQADEPEAEF